jgi:cytoskeleton protein RodZ
MSESLPQPPLTDIPTADVSTGGRLPGSVLRAERESRGLTMEAVAQATRFAVRQVDALERDDYASLPGMTTVRGFVRSYAKYLQLDATPLLDALDSVAPLSLPEVRRPTNMGEAKPGISALRRAVTYFFVACVAIILMLTVYGYVIQQAPQPMPLALNSLQNNQPGQVPPTIPTDSPPAVAAGPSVELATLVPLADSALAVVGVPATSAVLPALAKDIPAEMAGKPTVVAVLPPVPALSVTFDGSSWIEVRDATQKVVLSGEFSAGVTQKVEGKPPFQLWVGKASAVRVFSGERSIDLQPFTRAGVARLTVE